VEELKSQLEAVAAYAAITKGVELLEQKTAGNQSTLVHKTAWPKLRKATMTNDLVIYYLEEDQRLHGKLCSLTSDIEKCPGEYAAEHYMKVLESRLTQHQKYELIFKTAMDTYSFDSNTGTSTFTLRAVTDIMILFEMFNEWFKQHLPHMNRPAIDLNSFKRVRYGPWPDFSKDRQITITAVVNGTKGGDRAEQAGILEKAHLVFSNPMDQALAAVIHACKNNGGDLFGGLKRVRGCWSDAALFTQRKFGVSLAWFDNDDRWDSAASGSPLSQE
jgi:hypothetical protein